VTIYVESSAFLKIYLDEPDSTLAAELLSGSEWASARHTLVEVRRNLARSLDDDDLEHARRSFAQDWTHVDVIELDARLCERAVELAERTGVRTLDALHLGALRSLDRAVPLVTFDRRLAGAARSLGCNVLPG
jgi:uncharacterized protein